MAWASSNYECSTSAMGSTSPIGISYSTGGVLHGLGGGAGQRQQVSPKWAEFEAQRQYLNSLNSGVFTSTTAATTAPQKGASMMDEFKSYVREYKDWIFTIAIIAVIDHFFLDGALKEKLSAALGKKLDSPNDGKAA